MTIAQELNFGYSPGSSADFEDGLNPLVFDDDFNNDLGLDDDEDDGRYDQQGGNGTQLTKPKRNNNRKGPGNADKRATHNAVERARRESLNGRFTVSFSLFPSFPPSPSFFTGGLGRPTFVHALMLDCVTLSYRCSPSLYLP